MRQSLRFLLLLILAVASGVAGERSVAGRARAREALERLARENAERVRRLEAERLTRLEAHADGIRAAAALASRVPVAVEPPPPAPAPLEAPKVAPAIVHAELRPTPGEKRVRDRLRGLAGAIVPASSSGSRGKPEPAVLSLPADPPAEAAAEVEKKDDRKPGTGLQGEYWKFVDTALGGFPDVDRKVPTIVRVDPKIDFRANADFKLPFAVRNIAVRWRGYLYADADGIYTFTLGADDGAVLRLDGRLVVDDDGLHPYSEVAADVFLAQGYHPLEIRFFQNEGEAGATLSWVPPRGDPGPVPTGVLYPVDRLKAGQVPTITKIVPEHARSGQTVTIQGTGFPLPPEAVEATFDGEDMNAQTIDARTIRATVPPGVDVGQVVVRFRDVSSLGFGYESGDVFGLLGEYAPSPGGQPIESLYATSAGTLPGTFRRVEPAIAFYSSDGFGLPFPPQRFLARYRGALCVLDEGIYQLRLTCDGGARMLVDNIETISLDGVQATNPGQAVARLARGMHDVIIEYYENDGPASLILEWQRPGATSYETIPARALYPPPYFESRDPPTIEAIVPDAVTVGNEIEIVGENFAGDLASDRVLLNGVAVPAELSTPTKILLRVPPSAQTGPLCVQSGPLTSKPAQLTVLGRGLTGSYYTFDTDLDALPALPAGTLALTRVDPQLHFGEAYSFGVPFDPVRFAVEWTGSLETPYFGTYRFDIASDDGARLTIDGQVVVDDDGCHTARDRTGEVVLDGGRHAIIVDYFQNQGTASFDLSWGLPFTVGFQRIPANALYPESP